ncbi:hypothetical protein CPB86DRAFT_781328 [Serendipita vermifera]|nr:hypothetical protein CPB86DRAFT_781328 [Serendipita vermifera]
MSSSSEQREPTPTPPSNTSPPATEETVSPSPPRTPHPTTLLSQDQEDSRPMGNTGKVSFPWALTERV